MATKKKQPIRVTAGKGIQRVNNEDSMLRFGVAVEMAKALVTSRAQHPLKAIRLASESIATTALVLADEVIRAGTLDKKAFDTLVQKVVARGD